LSEEDCKALLSLHADVKSYQADEIILKAGVPTTHCAIITSGFVSRVKQLANGARQIVAFHVAGDAVDLQSILFTVTDHILVANNATTLMWVSHEDLLDLHDRYPTLGKALWLDTLADASIFREWTVNVGQRRARERIAHLFLEMGTRFDAIGQLKDDTYELPLSQSRLAEALGLSLVHMNKSLQTLRKEGCLVMRGRSVTLKDRRKLIALSGFDPGYLYLDSDRTKPLTTSKAVFTV
jgi:CRP-like cAMP-binding protein